jgi:hypothetical protein
MGMEIALLRGKGEVTMKVWVEQILQSSKNRSSELNPKQLFYREFDQALQQTSQPQTAQANRDSFIKLENLGLKAGISMGEIASRKKTLLWALSRREFPVG